MLALLFILTMFFFVCIILLRAEPLLAVRVLPEYSAFYHLIITSGKQSKRKWKSRSILNFFLFLYTSSYKSGGVILDLLRLSFRPSVCPRVRVCPDDISWTARPFLTELGMVVYYRESEFMQKNWFTIVIVKVTARAYMINIWLFLLYLLNCWSVCNQTWFCSTAS